MTPSPTLPMSWIRPGLWALPIAGLLTAWSTLGAQPDPTTAPEAWARFVTTTGYLVGHLLGSTGGTLLALAGVIALGAHLARTHAGRLGLAAMVVAGLGHALLLVPAALSTFATPALGHAYLAGHHDVMRVEFSGAMTATMMLGLLLALVGSVLLGVAV